MKENKQNLILILVAAGIIISLIVAIFVFSNNPKTSENTQLPNQDNMAGHHQSAPSNESVFNSLLEKKGPGFTLESFDGKQFEVEKLRGKKVVLFFTEGLMCYPSCWNQMAAFAQDSAFDNKDVITLSIGVDKKSEWNEAVAKMPELAKAIVLFDTDRKVSNEYGVLTLPSSMHKGQFPGHTYVILDREGVVKFVFDDPQMGVRNDELKSELEKIN